MNVALEPGRKTAKTKISIKSITTARKIQSGTKKREIRKNNDYLACYDNIKGQHGPHIEIIDKIVIFRGLENNGGVPKGYGPQMTG